MSAVTLFVVAMVAKPNTNNPPHCTTVTKHTEYVSAVKLEYPTSYIMPGQREAYQKMYCTNPPAVNTAMTTVCDWAAPPQVQITLGDEYVHVVRQDSTGKFLGSAVISTYQLCSHNITTVEGENATCPTVSAG